MYKSYAVTLIINITLLTVTDQLPNTYTTIQKNPPKCQTRSAYILSNASVVRAFITMLLMSNFSIHKITCFPLVYLGQNIYVFL